MINRTPILGALAGAAILALPAIGSAHEVINGRIACAGQTVAMSFALRDFAPGDYPVSLIAYEDATALDGSVGYPGTGAPNPYPYAVTIPAAPGTHTYKLNVSWQHPGEKTRRNVTVGPVVLACAPSPAPSPEPSPPLSPEAQPSGAATPAPGPGVTPFVAQPDTPAPTLRKAPKAAPKRKAASIRVVASSKSELRVCKPGEGVRVVEYRWAGVKPRRHLIPFLVRCIRPVETIPVAG